ncbi:MAG TPA: N-acetyltransferase [Bacillus bacterium]|nr:N-acetyltransferase [Bacillus sp. (in: firmicutes)]
MSLQFAKEDNRFVAKDSDGLEVGEITYRRGGNDVLVIEHTGVDPDYRGQGLAEDLVEKVVEKARNEGFKIKPVCSFAKKEFEKKEEYREFLAQSNPESL